MNGDGLIHIEFKSGGHDYFGSIAALFDTYAPETLGVSKQRLYDCKITPGRPYRNKICTIRKGSIKRKKGNRTNSKS